MAKRQTTEFWRSHLEGWQQSGLTQVAYCARHGLSIKSLHRWRRKEREATQTVKLPLTLIPANVSAPATIGGVRLHSPGGWRIDLPAGGTPWLADLLRQLP
jgi:hypothetical protein